MWKEIRMRKIYLLLPAFLLLVSGTWISHTNCLSDFKECISMEQNSSENSNRRQRITGAQKVELVERICADYAVAAGRFASVDGKKQKQQFWASLTNELNGMNGAIKSMSGWQKSFYDIRNGIRTKFAQIRNHAYKTGGGEPLDVELDPLEERLLSVLPPEQVDGIDCMEGGFDSNTIPNLAEARSAIQRTESPIIPMDNDATDPLSISESVVEHPTYSLDLEHSILSHYSVSQLPGPSTLMPNNQATVQTPAVIRLSSPTLQPELPLLSPSPPDASPATHSSHSDSHSSIQPQRAEALPPSTAPSNRTHHPRSRSVRNLYRTSLAKNSQESLLLQKEALKELRNSSSLKQQIIRLQKKESQDNERRHKELTTLLNQIIDTRHLQ